MSKNLKLKILELRDNGLTYNQISETLKCSKSSVCYYCGENQKDKTYKRGLKNREPLIKKFYHFRERKINSYTNSEKINNKINIILSIKIATFSQRKNRMFTIKELKDKIGDNPKCYLTGRDIDLSKGRSYHLDHIIPVSKGGDNSLENCNIACRDANQAKSDMLLEDFYQLCEDVIKNKNAGIG